MRQVSFVEPGAGQIRINELDADEVGLREIDAFQLDDLVAGPTVLSPPAAVRAGVGNGPHALFRAVVVVGAAKP